ncbi:hypothetical protein B7463_g11604, partial [Scytalidium lignicola]
MAINDTAEKVLSIGQIENVDLETSNGLEKGEDPRIAAFSPKEQKRIIRHIDQRLPSLGPLRLHSPFAVARIEKDRDDAYLEEFKLSAYLKNGLDLKVWGFAALFLLTTLNSYAIAYFLPIILNAGMGFGIAASQCLVAPPYILAAIVMYVFAYYGDKWHIRSPFILINGILSLIGLPLLGYLDNVGARYFGVFIATAACNANIPCVLTWQANNIRGQWKRAFCSATLLGSGGIGGIIGGTVFRNQDKPGYRPGILTCMISSGLIIIITIALDIKFYRANKRAAASGKLIERLEGFRYTY